MQAMNRRNAFGIKIIRVAAAQFYYVLNQRRFECKRLPVLPVVGETKQVQ